MFVEPYRRWRLRSGRRESDPPARLESPVIARLLVLLQVSRPAVHGKRNARELVARQAGHFRPAVPESEIRLAPQEVGGTCAGHKLDLCILVVINKRANVTSDECAGPCTRRDPYDGAGPVRGAPAIDLQRIQFQRFGKAQKILASARQLVAVALAHEEFSAQALLERGHPAAQGRRAHLRRPCGTGKPAATCDGKEQPKVIPLERFIHEMIVPQLSC